MKHIPHNTDFTFIYLGVKYRAKVINTGFSYSKIQIYKYAEPKWYSIIYDPINVILDENALERKMYYDSKLLLSWLRIQLDKYLEKQLKKKILKHKKIDIQLSFDEINNN